MAQVLVRQPHQAKNFMKAGVRLLLRDSAGAGNRGYNFVGNLRDPKFSPNAEFYEHFSASSGENVKDYDAVNKLAASVAFTLDEISTRNFKRFWLSTDPTVVAANASATAGPDVVVAGITGDTSSPEYGRQSSGQRSALAVYNVTDSAMLVLDTDYAIDVIHGWTSIRWLVDTHNGDSIRIGTSTTASTAYGHVVTAGRKLAPLSAPKLELPAIFQIVSKTGINAEWRVAKGVIKPSGDMTVSIEEATTLNMIYEALDNSALVPAYPFGEWIDYGYDDAGAGLISG